VSNAFKMITIWSGTILVEFGRTTYCCSGG
jgi:hypothetical protein